MALSPWPQQHRDIRAASSASDASSSAGTANTMPPTGLCTLEQTWDLPLFPSMWLMPDASLARAAWLRHLLQSGFRDRSEEKAFILQ